MRPHDQFLAGTKLHPFVVKYTASDGDSANTTTRKKVICFEADVDFDLESFQLKGQKGYAFYIKAGPDDIKRRQTFPFLDLSPELRNMIYREALVVPRGVNVKGQQKHILKIAYSSGLKKAQRVWFKPCVNILQVNKQIRDEALRMFYVTNTFNFASPTTLELFSNAICSNNFRLLRHIVIEKTMFVFQRNALEVLLLHLPDLESLRIAYYPALDKYYCTYDDFADTVAKALFPFCIRIFDRYQSMDKIFEMISFEGRETNAEHQVPPLTEDELKEVPQLLDRRRKFTDSIRTLVATMISTRKSAVQKVQKNVVRHRLNRR